MRSFVRAASLAASFFLLAGALPAQDSAGRGFTLAGQPYPGGTALSITTTLSSGDWIVFDGTTLVRYAPDGTPLRQLGSLPAFAFPSFVVLAPDEQFLLFGESSTGSIYRLFPSTTGSPELVVTLPLNYDAAMHDDSEVFVSAATCGFSCGNEIWRVDVASGAASLVARVPGASGPLAFDSTGGLFYGTVTAQFPPPPQPSSILRWSAAQLASHTVLGATDAQLIGAGFVGATRLVHDPVLDALYLMENNFGSGENRIRRVLGSAAQSPLLVEGRPFLSMGNLSFQPGPDAARFLPYQPASGGTLVYTTTDFGAVLERAALTPRRPSLAIAGAGTLGPGDFTLTLAGGPPNGFARVLFCPQTSFHAVEAALPFGHAPLFLALDLGSLGSVPGLLSIDAQGGLGSTYTNPGGYEGQFAVQLLLLDSQPHLAGTSSPAFL